MKFFCDESPVDIGQVPTHEIIASIYREKDSAIEEASLRSNSSISGGNLGDNPFEITFTDRYDHNWKVIVDKTDNEVEMFIPCAAQVMWNGPSGIQREALNSETQWVKLQFSYKEKGAFMQPEKVVLQISGYKDPAMDKWQIDDEKWNTLLEHLKKGTALSASLLS